MLLATPIKIAVTGTTARSAQLPAGVYWITSDIDCWVLTGGSTVVAAADDNPLWSKGYIKIRVHNSTLDGYVAAIRQASTSGSLWIIRVPD